MTQELSGVSYTGSNQERETRKLSHGFRLSIDLNKNKDKYYRMHVSFYNGPGFVPLVDSYEPIALNYLYGFLEDNPKLIANVMAELKGVSRLEFGVAEARNIINKYK